MNANMKDSGIEWIGLVPKTWVLKKNKYNFELEKEIVGDSSSHTQLLSLTKNGIKAINEDEQSGKTPLSFDTYQVVHKNDIVMCLFDLDVSAVFSGISPYEGMISPAYKCFRCLPHLYPKYVDYYFRTVFDGRKYKRYSKNVRFSLGTEEFMAIPILVPPLDEQKQIADTLDCLIPEVDNINANTRESIEGYRKLRQIIITEAVTGHVGREESFKKVEDLFGEEVPLEWDVCKLKYLSDEIGDGLHSTPEYDDEGSIFFVNGNNIGGEYLTMKDNTNRINEEELAKYKTPKLNMNTIMISLNGATYGKTSFYNMEDVLLGKSAGYITLKENVNKRYIRYYLQSTIAQELMTYSLNGTTIQNLSLGTLNEFPIIIPDEHSQKIIVEYLDEKCKEIDQLIKKKEIFLEEMENYKKSLIYEYVTGKKNVE